MYESHSVENITRHEADKVTTDTTIAYILDVIKRSKKNGEKSICFVTGVPGAGKTLVGLDVAVKQTYQGFDTPVEDEGAVYLSGNGPLVAVLNEALAKDNYAKCKERGEAKKLSDSRREVGKFIQIIHRYRDNMLAKIKNPVENGILEIDSEKAVRMQNSGFGEVEHVAIFDEAQRSWTHKRLADYLKRGGTYGNKLKVPNFPVSEASFLIWSLDQREDWATIAIYANSNAKLVLNGIDRVFCNGITEIDFLKLVGSLKRKTSVVVNDMRSTVEVTIGCLPKYLYDNISITDIVTMSLLYAGPIGEVFRINVFANGCRVCSFERDAIKNKFMLHVILGKTMELQGKTVSVEILGSTGGIATQVFNQVIQCNNNKETLVEIAKGKNYEDQSDNDKLLEVDRYIKIKELAKYYYSNSADTDFDITSNVKFVGGIIW